MADLEKIAEDLSALTVIEAAELSKMLEEKWGVSAAAPVAVAAAGAPGADAGGEAAAEAAAALACLSWSMRSTPCVSRSALTPAACPACSSRCSTSLL